MFTKTKALFVLFSFVLFSPLNAFATEAVNSSNDQYEKALQSYHQEDFSSAYIHLKNTLKENSDHIPAQILMGKMLVKKGFFIDASLILNEALTLGGDIEFIIAPLAESLFYQKAYDEVINLGKGKQLSAKSVFQWKMLAARAYNKLQQSSQELKAYQLAHQYSSNNSEKTSSINGLASFYLAQQNFAKAEVLLEKSFAIESDNYLTWYIKGQIEKKQGEIEQATSSLKQAHSLNSKYIDISRALANAYLQQGKNEQALEMVEQVLLKAPFDPRAKLLKANLLLAENNNELAKTTLNALNQQMGLIPEQVVLDNDWLLFINGISAYLLENYESAIRELIKYNYSNPDNLHATAMIADAYIKLNQPNYAREILDKHSIQVAENLNLSILLCDLYIKDNKLFKCQNLLEKVIVLHPKAEQIPLIQAKLFVGRKHFKQAISLLENSSSQALSTEIKSYLISLYMRTRQYAKAAKLIDNLLQQYPNNLPLINAMSAALIKLNQPKQAYNVAKLILSVEPNHFAARYNQASALLELRQPQQAKEMLLSLIKEQPNNKDSRLLLAKADVSMGDASAAIQTLEHLLISDETNRAANEMLVALFKLTGQYEQALNKLNILLRYDRLASQYIRTKAEIHIALGDKEQVQKQFNILFDLWYDDAPNLVVLSRLQRRATYLDGARASINRALKIAPHLSTVIYADARLSLYEKELSSTNKKIVSLKKTVKNSSKVIMLEGDMYLSNKQAEKAQMSYLKAFSLNNNNGMAIAKSYNLAIAGFLSEQFEQTLIQALLKQKHNFLYRNLLADYYLLNQRYNEARYEYLQIKDIAKLPNKADVLNNLAYASMHEDLSSAAEFAKEASEIKPNSATILDTYGWILSKQNQYKQSLGILRQANAVNANDPAIQFHLGYTLAKLGRTNEAIELIKQSLASKVTFDDIKQAEKLLNSLIIKPQ